MTTAAQMVTLKAFDPSDYDDFAQLRIDIEPDHLISPLEIQCQDETRDVWCDFYRVLAYIDDVLVGFGEYGQEVYAFEEHQYMLDVFVHPQHFRRGVGRAVLEHLEQRLAALHPEEVRVRIQSHLDYAVAFAKKNGYLPESSYWEMFLPLSPEIATRFKHQHQNLFEKVRAAGIDIRSLAELSRTDPDYKRKLYALESGASQDIPQANPHTFPSFETWEKGFLGNPRFLPEAYLVAVHDDQFVGVDVLWGASLDRGLLYAGLTAIDPTWRKKGVAKALGVTNIIWAAQNHYKKIYDWTGTDNTDMLAIQANLGYQRLPQWLILKKEFQSSGDQL